MIHTLALAAALTLQSTDRAGWIAFQAGNVYAADANAPYDSLLTALERGQGSTIRHQIPHVGKVYVVADEILHRFACDVADQVLPERADRKATAEAAIDAKRAWLKGIIDDKELAEARQAAYRAAREALEANDNRCYADQVGLTAAGDACDPRPEKAAVAVARSAAAALAWRATESDPAKYEDAKRDERNKLDAELSRRVSAKFGEYDLSWIGQ